MPSGATVDLFDLVTRSGVGSFLETSFLKNRDTSRERQTHLMGHAGAPQSCAQFVKGVSERRTRDTVSFTSSGNLARSAERVTGVFSRHCQYFAMSRCNDLAIDEPTALTRSFHPSQTCKLAIRKEYHPECPNRVGVRPRCTFWAMSFAAVFCELNHYANRACRQKLVLTRARPATQATKIAKTMFTDVFCVSHGRKRAKS